MTYSQYSDADKIVKELEILKKAKVQWEKSVGVSNFKVSYKDGSADVVNSRLAFPDFEFLKSVALENIDNKIVQLTNQFKNL